MRAKPGDARTSRFVIENREAKPSPSVESPIVLMTRGAKRAYRHPLIATDLEDAEVISPVLRLLDADAAVVLLSAYRIPFSGLHSMLGASRLLRALEARTIEAMDAFVRTSGVDPVRFERVVRRGDVRDHVLHEVRSRDVDLVVLAYEYDSAFARLSASRLVARLLDIGCCDVVVMRDVRANGTCCSNEDLLAPGPW